MSIKVGLIGYSYIQAMNFANLLSPADKDLSKALFLSANHINYVLHKKEEVLNGIDYELTYNFEEAENEEHVMHDVHFYMQDILSCINLDAMDLNEIASTLLTSISNILFNKRTNNKVVENKYLKYVTKSVKSGGKEAVVDLIERCSQDKNDTDLRKLYFAQKNSKDKTVSLYNTLFAAIKAELISFLENNLNLPGVRRYDCRNNCLTFYGNLEEEDLINFLFKVHVSCRAEDSPLSKCINNIVFNKNMDDDITYIYSTFPLDHPVYFKLLEEADFLHLAVTEDFVGCKGIVAVQLKYMMDIIPMAKTKLYVYEDVDLPISVDEVNQIAYEEDYSLTKCFVGDIDFNWTDNGEGKPKSDKSYFKEEDAGESAFDDTECIAAAMTYLTEEDFIGESMVNIDAKEAKTYFDGLIQQTRIVGMKGLRKPDNVTGFLDSPTEKERNITASKDSNGYVVLDWYGKKYAAKVVDGISLLGQLDEIKANVNEVAVIGADMAKLSFNESKLSPKAVDELSEMLKEVKGEVIDSVRKEEAALVREEQENTTDFSKVAAYREEFEKHIAEECENLLLAGTCNNILHRFVSKVSKLKNLQCVEGYNSDYLADNLKVSLVNALYSKYTMDAYSLWSQQLSDDLNNPDKPNSEIYINLLNELF